MGNQTQPDHQEASNEIDLGQLMQLIGKVFNRIFKGILRIFLYFKGNAIILGALIVIGVGIGFLLATLVDKRLKTEVIVKPNFESKDYLYDVVKEIQANIADKDTLFFKELGIDVNGLRGFEISIEPIEDVELDNEKLKENTLYLEMLQNYKDNDFVIDVVRAEILKKSGLTHRITFLHKNPVKGEEYVRKMMDYINANPYFDELKKVYAENTQFRINSNKELVKQIDDLVANYTKQISENVNATSSQGMVLLDKEKALDVPNILTLKNALLKQTEQKQIEAVEEKEAISIINFGKTQVVQKQFLNRSLLMVPLLLVLAFFTWSLLAYLNRKAMEIKGSH